MDPFSGVSLTLALQTQTDLVTVMQTFSLFGLPEIYLFLIPAIFWCYDPRLGIRLALLTPVCAWSNDILKQFFHLPRPYWLSPDVSMLDLNESVSFGFPSGHSQVPVSFLGMIGYWYRNIYLWIGIVVLLFFIGLSRVYLGVHFSLDVLGGWGVGIAILILFLLLDKPVSALVSRLSGSVIIIVALLISFLMAGMSHLVQIMNRNFEIPTNWFSFGHGASGISNLFSPSTNLLVTGFFFGIVAGWVIARDIIRYSSSGSIFQRCARYFLGMTGLLLIWVFLGILIHLQSGDGGALLSWVRGVLMGIWIACGAPYLFQMKGLSSSRSTGRIL